MSSVPNSTQQTTENIYLDFIDALENDELDRAREFITHMRDYNEQYAQIMEKELYARN